ncbi:MAG: aminotransferase class I/II-fold pyridoxal phosphate-dependent enzyme [Planctomycetes bacterium]|nr:aminotransferase class I/II-fold pyridoxal phosphate-dependent enzyme [Planctomycetota bacterium]
MKPAMIKPAERTKEVRYAVRDIVLLAQEAKKKGLELLNLNIGDPIPYDFHPPKHLVDAVHKAMLDNRNGYCPSPGIDEAIDAIKKEAHGKGISNILDVFVTTGGSEAIELCLTALVNEGENILIPYPCYPLYPAVLAKLQSPLNPYFLDEENDWQPDVKDIEKKINSKTRAILLINPNNPTGSLYSIDTLKRIVELALEHNLIILSDEIYDKLLFDGKKYTSIASLTKEASVITFNGISKSYIAPGWRIGWGIISGRDEVMHDYYQAVRKLTRARLCANHPAQYAIKPALEGDQSHLIEFNRVLEKRRDLSVKMLNGIKGISCVKPEGAFYAFPQLHFDVDDGKFVKELIMETGVVVVPGNGFGQKPGSNHFRIVILPREEILTKAFEKIERFSKRFKVV